MANDFPYVYPYSREEAKRLNQLPLWRDSHKENVACKDAIEEAIRRDFDGMYLDKDCAESVLGKFGYHRVAYVLANSLQRKDYDGRFSRGNHDWAKQNYIPPDKDAYTTATVNSPWTAILRCWTVLSTSTAGHTRALPCSTIPTAYPIRKSKILRAR
jgi:hypothetical protein